MSAEENVWTDHEREKFWSQAFRIQKAGTRYPQHVPGQRYLQVGGNLLPGMIVVVQAVEPVWVASIVGCKWRKKRKTAPRAYVVTSFDTAKRLLVATPTDAVQKRPAPCPPSETCSTSSCSPDPSPTPTDPAQSR